MSSRIRLVHGDTRPQIILSLTDKDTGVAIDVSAAGASVVMKFRAEGTTTVLQTLTATKLTGKVASDGSIDYSVTTPGAGGRVMFSWPAGALSIDPGYYEGEVAVNFSDGTLQTVYSVLKFSVRNDF